VVAQIQVVFCQKNEVVVWIPKRYLFLMDPNVPFMDHKSIQTENLRPLLIFDEDQCPALCTFASEDGIALVLKLLDRDQLVYVPARYFV
jgi:hypothetical protein